MDKSNKSSKQKLELKQCSVCGKTYNPNEVNTSNTKCETHNKQELLEKRKKDNARKYLNRKNEISLNLEKLADIED